MISSGELAAGSPRMQASPAKDFGLWSQRLILKSSGRIDLRPLIRVCQQIMMANAPTKFVNQIYDFNWFFFVHMILPGLTNGVESRGDSFSTITTLMQPQDSCTTSSNSKPLNWGSVCMNCSTVLRAAVRLPFRLEGAQNLQNRNTLKYDLKKLIVRMRHFFFNPQIRLIFLKYKKHLCQMFWEKTSARVPLRIAPLPRGRSPGTQGNSAIPENRGTKSAENTLRSAMAVI